MSKPLKEVSDETQTFGNSKQDRAFRIGADDGVMRAGKSHEVTGQKQNDGTWIATQITINDTPPAPPQVQQGGQGKLPPPTNSSKR